ncbi:MAG: tryptophan synthase subunit alpha [Nitrospirae bacterium]|nr:tryptophan synthase subunit alpha [Nitrospirota bacterium]
MGQGLKTTKPNRIDETFQRLKAKGEKALIPFVTAGDPDIDATKRLVIEMERAGADIIELGVPFSDPIADGPTIQRASYRSLKAGTTLRKIIGIVAELRKTTNVPLVLMTYYNPVFKYGVSKFVRDAVDAGVDGIIVPDLPPEEGEGIIEEGKRMGLDTIFLIAPTSTKDRIKMISSISTGFIYYVSLTGVTGARGPLPETIEASVKRVRKITNKPVAVGFGISTSEQAGRVASFADGVIIGSAIVGLIEKNLNGPDLIEAVAAFVRGIKAGIENSRVR